MNFKHYFWTTGEPWRSIRSWALPRFLRVLHSVLMCTLRITASGFEQGRPFVENNEGHGALFVLWHDHTLLPLHLFRNKNIGVMISRSRSGQVQAAFWNLYGWPTVWGSTRKREGIQALRELLRLLRGGQSFGFTPDGPKGPRHKAQPGVLYLATHAPAAVMPIGVAAANAWRLPTWDRYLIPKPFSRVHVHLGAPLDLPDDIPREATEQWQRFIEEAIDCADTAAARALPLGARASRPHQSGARANL